MAAKVNNFSELGNILSDKMCIASSISKLHGIFRIPQIVHGLGMEKEKGVPLLRADTLPWPVPPVQRDRVPRLLLRPD